MTERRKMKKPENVWFLLGALAVLAMGIPYLILGKDAIFVYHDQLDGEVIAYLLQARHLWDGSGIFPEFMNGAERTALTMPAPACVLLYRLLPAETALACMQVAGSFVGYVGMFLLLWWAAEDSDILSGRKGTVGFLAMTVGCMYAYLPFLPVYGLSQYGLPMLLYCVLRLRERDRSIRERLLYYAYVVFFGANSSLVLSGFAVLGIWAVGEIIAALRRKYSAAQGFAWMLLLLTYLLENGALFLQIFGVGESTVSHKAEYALTAVSFWEQWKTNLLQGGQHSVDYHGWILLIAVFTVIAVIRRRAVDSKRIFRSLAISCGCIVFIATAAALWDSGIGVSLRSGWGALKGFQANRVLWLSPCLWYFALGCCLLLLLRQLCEKRCVRNVILFTVTMILTVTTAEQILFQSNLKPNLQKTVNREYGAMSFRDYYAIDVLDQVQEYIYDNFGERPEDYRVVSLGIDPAAALYHGFYCLDGYSNNYSLEYKHCFRKIIAPELAKSEYLEDNFDHWGNRCYLFSAECPGYYTIQKGGFYFQNYEIDTERLRELGGTYLLSAAYIDHSENTGLEPVREEAFETEDSYYRIYLYRIMEK